MIAGIWEIIFTGGYGTPINGSIFMIPFAIGLLWYICSLIRYSLRGGIDAPTLYERYYDAKNRRRKAAMRPPYRRHPPFR